MKTKMKFGVCICTHPWHDRVIAICDYELRVQEIRDCKPANEVPTRLRLFRPLTEEEKAVLPATVRARMWKVREAQNAWEKIGVTWRNDGEKVRVVWEKARSVWREALDALILEVSTHKTEMEAWHSQVCGCTEWNGKEIIFPKIPDGKEIIFPKIPVVKKVGEDYSHSPGGALTLRRMEVDESDSHRGGKSTRVHRDGWTITGFIHEDYEIWVNDFEASHPKYGRVWGDFETEIYADTEEGFADFYKKHPPEKWDYYDI